MSFDPWFRNVVDDVGPSILAEAEASMIARSAGNEVPAAYRDIYERERLSFVLLDPRSDDDSQDAAVEADAAAYALARVNEAKARAEPVRAAVAQARQKQTGTAAPAATSATNLDELSALIDGIMSAPPAPPVIRSEDSLQEWCAAWSTEPKSAKRDRFAIGAARHGMYPLSCVSMLAGPGGTFKTAASVLLCQHVAAGEPFAGLPVTPGSALIVSLEEDADDMSRRLGATAVTQFHPDVRENIVRRVGLIAMPGIDGRFTEQMFKSVYPSQMVPRLIARARIHAQRTGLPVRLIVIDHARLATCGDVNDSEMVTALIRALGRVASETGAAVVLLAHSPKSSLSPHREEEFSAADVLGSGAFVDNARFASVVFPLTASERKRFGLDADAARRYVGLRVIKSNFSEAGRVIYLRKVPVDGWDVAVPEPVELTAPATGTRQDNTLEQRVLAYVSARPGQLTVDQLAKKCAGNDGPFAAGRPAIKAAAQRLIESGRMQLREPTPDERAAADIPARTRQALFAADVY